MDSIAQFCANMSGTEVCMFGLGTIVVVSVVYVKLRFGKTINKD